VRAAPEIAAEAGWRETEQVSPHSTRVTTSPPDLDAAMARARAIAPTHHACDVAATGQEFLITDRVFVTFKTAPSEADLGAFVARYGLVLIQSYTDREFLLQVTDHTGMNPVKLVVRLTEQEPMVERADHDLNLRVARQQFAPPTDPAYAREWHLHTLFQDGAVDLRSSSRGEGAWQILNHMGSADVVVGVTGDSRGHARGGARLPRGAQPLLELRDRHQHLRAVEQRARVPPPLAGESLAGAWTLSVVDAAPVDVGRLNRWELAATLAEQSAVELEDAPGLSIPDDDAAGVERTLMVTATGAVGRVAVGVDITHTFIGDLEVSLAAPSEATVNLHRRTGGEADNLVSTFTAASAPVLGALRGQPMQGAWRLKVADRDRIDTGKLNRWSLRADRQ
jgi:subtilisin-like proprotein convertase family protein